jgi:hypothetical protein
MFSNGVTVREPPLGVPNLGYLKNPPKPEFLNSTVSLNNLTSKRPEWSGKAAPRLPRAQWLKTPNYGPPVQSLANTYKNKQIGPEYARNADPIPVYEYKKMHKGTTGFTEPTKLTSNNASRAVNRAKLVEKEVGAFREGVVRAPEVPAPGASGCLGGSCWGWGGNIKKTRNRRKTKKNTRRRSTLRRR